MQGGDWSLFVHSTHKSFPLRFNAADWIGLGDLETTFLMNVGLTV